MHLKGVQNGNCLDFNSYVKVVTLLTDDELSLILMLMMVNCDFIQVFHSFKNEFVFLFFGNGIREFNLVFF